jgi:hypothetical protein
LVVTWAFCDLRHNVIGCENMAALGVDDHARARCPDLFLELLRKIWRAGTGQARKKLATPTKPLSCSCRRKIEHGD